MLQIENEDRYPVVHPVVAVEAAATGQEGGKGQHWVVQMALCSKNYSTSGYVVGIELDIQNAGKNMARSGA